jgi:hypothetical protein
MRKVSLFIAGCAVLALAVGLFGQTRGLPDIMKEIQATYGGGIGARGASTLDQATVDTAKIAADAEKLQGLFKEAEGQFTKLKMTEAAGLAKEASDNAGALAKEAKTGKIADAKASKASIAKCQGCHAKFKGESDGAGSFKIKGQ